jgi:SH3 domain-containing protein
MPLALISDLSRSLLVRALVATAAVFAVIALATGALPINCLAGAGSCAAHAAVEVKTLPPDPSAAEPQAKPTLQQQVLADLTATTDPTLTHNEVVTKSFALLNTSLATPLNSASVPTTAAIAASASNPDDMNAPKVRTVKTVSIRADGTPDTGTVAVDTSAASQPETQVAEVVPTVAPLVAPASSAEPVALPKSPTVVPAVPKHVAEVEPAVIKAAPSPKKVPIVRATGKGGTVKGAGANVHADARSASSVVFAITGGSKVKVLGSSKGWVHITDAKGRSGWIYKDYITS